MADQKLLDQIAIRRAKGVNESDLLNGLVSEGWSPEDVNGALAIGKIQQQQLTAKQSYTVLSPRPARVQHGRGFFFEIAIVAILLVSAPGAYGLVTSVFIPVAKGEPVALADTTKGYELLRDVPALIPVGESSARSSGQVTTNTTPPISAGSGSASTPMTVPAPQPATSVQLSQSSPKAPSVSFSASSNIVPPGSTVILNWRSDNANSCIGTGFDTGGQIKGSLRVTIPAGVKYTVTCTNEGGSTVRRISIATRRPDPTPAPNPTPNPTPVTYTLTASAGANGTISPSGSLTVTTAATQTYTITPANGYKVATLVIDGSSVTAANTHTFSNITGNHTISATFSAVVVTPPPAPVPVTYTITASAGANGTLSPSGSQSATAASSKTYTITPASGYKIATVVVDGASVTAASPYTFTNITANHTIAATFSLIPVTPPPSSPGTITTTAGLITALKAAKGGETLTLAAGTYGDFYASNLTFSSPVIITSADTSHPAVFTNFIMEKIDGLTFRRVDFKVVTPAWVGYNVYESKHITFDRVHMYGPPGAPDNQAEGIRFFDSSDLAFTNSEVEQLAHGVTFARSSRITVSGNHIHHMNADTLDFGVVNNVLISGNVLHDWYPTNGAHPDAIQFAGDSTDVTIRGNLVFRGDGQNSQGFFIADGTYSNMTITDNLIAGTGSSAIRPIGVTDLTLTNNRLVTFAGGDPTYILVQYSDRVTSSGNIASSISYSNTTTNITESNNVANAPTVSDRGAAAIQEWLGSHSSVASIYNSIAFAPTHKQSQLASALSAVTGGIQDFFGGMWQAILSVFKR